MGSRKGAVPGALWPGAHPPRCALANTAGRGAFLAKPPASGYLRGRAAIAQLVEHVIRNDGVTGSNPVCGTSQNTHLVYLSRNRNFPRYAIGTFQRKPHARSALIGVVQSSAIEE